MGIRTILRIGMVALAAAVGLLVWAQWRPEPAADADSGRPSLDLPEGERDVVSSSRGLSVSQSRDGEEVLHVSAVRQLDFADGWNVWEGPEVTIFGRRAEADDDDVFITGDTMRTAGEIGNFTEVRIIGTVVARLPGGGSFETRRIDYDWVTGVAHNCNRNLLGYAGLDVRSDCLRFDTGGNATSGQELTAEELRMWGDLSIAADPEGEGNLPAGLTGGGEELRFRPGDDVVTLDRQASLTFAGTSVRADSLDLMVGATVRDLEGIHAVGGARLRIGGDAAGEGNAAGDGGGGGRVLSGDDVAIELSDNAVESVRASGGPARLALPGQGTLTAAAIEMTTAGDTVEILARGSVAWNAAPAVQGPGSLTAREVEMRSAAGRMERLAARGGVELDAGEDGGAFSGPSVSMTWKDGLLATAEWPDGVALRDAERSVRAGSAERDAAGGWVLEGEPRPHVEATGLTLDADTVKLSENRSVVASGEAAGTLGGDRLEAGAALFGDVPEVRFRAGVATLGEEGETVLREDVQVVWETQSLVTTELRLERSPGRLRASQGFELVAALDRESEEPGLVTVTAQDLLVEQGAGEIRVAGEADLRQGDRTISAQRLAIFLDETGGWRTVEATGAVEFREPEITAQGTRLRYHLDSEELELFGTAEAPARFVYGDLEYRSAEALRVLRQGEDVVIQATEAGRTTTKVVRADGTEGAGSSRPR